MSWLKTYYPLLLIISFITLSSTIISFREGCLNSELWMQAFMAGFFLVFSFFKLLDLSGFAKSYRTYDLLARWWKPYGYIYPFLELGLGILFLSGCCLRAAYWAAFLLMGFSTLGVAKSLLDKKAIRCACLGTVLNLPMTAVTLVEDLSMVIMAGVMLWG
jgi:hypothetical protein